MTWDAAVPAGSDLMRTVDDVIRELKTDIALALTEEGDFPVSAADPKFYYRGTKGATGARPTRGGFFADETKSALYRDTGAAWEAVAYLIPATTKTVFYQAAAPTGWTRDTSALNNRFIRVVTAGSPGTTGGNFGFVDAEASHTHSFSVVTGGPSGTTSVNVFDASASVASAGHTHSDTGTSGAGSSHQHAHDSSHHAYGDFLLAAKDAY